MTPTFRWPTDSRVVSSGFTDPRSYGQHNAIDIVAPLGAPVRAIARGTVIFAGWAGSAGWSVWMEHTEGWRSHYCHLSLMRVAVRDGVGDGYRIGDVGSTGLSTGPHLHLNLFAPTKPATGLSAYVAWVGKWAVNPLDYLTEEDDMADLKALETRISGLEKRKAFNAHVFSLMADAALIGEKGRRTSARAAIERVRTGARVMRDLLDRRVISP